MHNFIALFFVWIGLSGILSAKDIKKKEPVFPYAIWL